jgi:acyl-coenzyme A thioesterase 13
MGTPAAARAFLEASCGADTTLVSFDATALRGLEAEAVEAGRVRARLPLDAERANAYGTAHGGLIATAVDVVSSAALHTVRANSGVSVSLSVEYLAPAAAADGPRNSLVFDARVVKAGRFLAVLAVDVLDGGGRLVALGRHTKFVGEQHQQQQEGGGGRRSRL